MSFAAQNCASYRAYLAIVNSECVLSNIHIRLRHEANSIGRNIRGSRGHDLNSPCERIRLRSQISRLFQDKSIPKTF